MDQGGTTSPFVMKTYQMVNDPSTDHLIRWGTANNSFIVVDCLEFSHRILPSFFKHNNFSSFVRQLNTYGFRKVDPDKWEFANEWFLRGQKHLLPNMTRRKRVPRAHHYDLQDGGDDHDLLAEVERLRDEQKSLEDEIKVMNRRLEATERRPQQMMAFLCKVVEDPEILPRIIMERDRTIRNIRLCDGGPDKRRHLLMMSSSSSSSGVAQSISAEDDDGGTIGTISSSSTNFELSPSSPDTCHSSGLIGLGPYGRVQLGHEQYNWVGAPFGLPNHSSFIMGATSDSVQLEHIPDYMSCVMDKENTPPYPFSLLDGGF